MTLYLARSLMTGIATSALLDAADRALRTAFDCQLIVTPN
jgi:hypothetical protein